MRRSATIYALMAALALGAAGPAFAQQIARPESVGLSSERLQRLDAALQADVDNRRKAGEVVLVARHGKVAYLKAYGMADAERGVAMRPDSLFRLYSTTKPMVSVALLILYEEGRFQLTDPVEKYIPSFAKLQVYDDAAGGLRPPRRKPTIQDIFRHTSGFVGGSGYGGQAEKISKAAKIDGDLAAHMETLATLPLAYDPGEEWRYGPEHEVQAYLVEKLSGMPLEQFLRTRIFEPLRMNDTFYTVPAAKMARYTAVYTPDGAGGLKALEGSQDSAYARSAAQRPGGGSGLSSTAADQFRFGQMLLNGGELDGARILSRKTVEMMLSDQLPAAVKQVGFSPTRTFGGLRYGLGIGVMGDVAASGRLGSVGTAEWAGARNTIMYIDPKEQMITIAFTQYFPGDFDWMNRVQGLAYQALVDKPPAP